MSEFEKMDVFISDRAFVHMTIAAIESYHDECIALLLGYNTRGRIVVEDSVVYQTAKRKPTEVEPNWKREVKVREALVNLTQLQRIGYFHSHPQWGKNKGLPELSKQDVDSMITREIELIVAINENRKSAKWNMTNKGLTLSGTISKFHLSYAAFYKKASSEGPRQYPIICPYALGFNQTFP